MVRSRGALSLLSLISRATSTNAKRYWRSGDDPLNHPKEHIQEWLGGYGLYYRNAMQLVGLTYLEDGQERLTESALGSPSGRLLAETFTYSHMLEGMDGGIGDAMDAAVG